MPYHRPRLPMIELMSLIENRLRTRKQEEGDVPPLPRELWDLIWPMLVGSQHPVFRVPVGMTECSAGRGPAIDAYPPPALAAAWEIERGIEHAHCLVWLHHDGLPLRKRCSLTKTLFILGFSGLGRINGVDMDPSERYRRGALLGILAEAAPASTGGGSGFSELQEGEGDGCAGAVTEEEKWGMFFKPCGVVCYQPLRYDPDAPIVLPPVTRERLPMPPMVRGPKVPICY